MDSIELCYLGNCAKISGITHLEEKKEAVEGERGKETQRDGGKQVAIEKMLIILTIC